MKNRKNSKSVIGLVLTTILLMVFGVFITPAQGKLYGGTFVAALTADPLRLEPTSFDYSALAVWPQIYQNMLYFDAEGKVVPDLAKSWKISDDGRQITFHLVRGVTWHDGAPFTSADVKFSYEAILMKRLFVHKAFMKPVLNTIETPDDYTVIFKFKSPPLFLLPMFHSAYRGGGIYPKHLWKDNPDPFTNPCSHKPVGTGPFKFKEWKRGDHVTLVRNENYWKKGKPYIDKIVYKVYPDPTTRILALERGEVHHIPLPGVPHTHYTKLASNPAISVGTHLRDPGASLFLIYINSDPDFVLHKELSDIRVRQAIATAINREEIIKKVFFGASTVATGPVSHPTHDRAWHNPKCDKYYPARGDIKKANKMLDEAGYPKGPDGIRFKIDVDYMAERDYSVRAAEVFFAQMQPLGIKMNMKGLDKATAFENLLKTYKYDVHIGYMGGSAPNGIGGGAGLSAMYSKNIIPGSFEVNFVHYNNPKYDALYEQLLKVTDIDKRIGLAWKLQEMYMKEASLILVCVNPKTYAVRDYVGFPADTSGFMIRDVSWIKGKKRTGK